MQGLELAKRYYEEVGRPMLERDFPELLPRLAAGLVGEGSECLGFDDAISQDHDFGAGFCLWFSAEDYNQYGNALQDAYDRLPGEFAGVPARLTSVRGGGRVGVFEIEAFYSRFIGMEQPPKSLMRWLHLPEDKLAAVVGGQYLRMDWENFLRSARRSGSIIRGCPDQEDAARAAKMAQSGQYNYGRCMRRGDTVAAMLALDEFVRQAISMVYLLNRTYMPYYKWMFRGMENFQILPEVAEKNPGAFGDGRYERDVEAAVSRDGILYVNQLDPRVGRIEEICQAVVGELRKQGLTDSRDAFLEAHTWEIAKRIQDPELKKCHVMEG